MKKLKSLIIYSCLLLRGGHGPGRHDLGPARPEPGRGQARPVDRYVGRGTVTIKKFYFRSAPARARVGRPAGRALISFVFYPKTVKDTKIQHKTWAVPREAQARSTRPWTNF